MRPHQRGHAPAFLTPAREAKWRDRFARRRERDPNCRFAWPTLQKRSLDRWLRPALEALTDAHCAYCDGYPLREQERTPAIDHFRPKSNRAFWHLVYSWTNLYIACGHCNDHKLEQWEEALLAPDELDYAFDRYFDYEESTGRIKVNAAAPTSDQHRAEATLRIFGFNEGDKPIARRQMVRAYLRQRRLADLGEEEQPVANDFPYRFVLE